MKKLILASNSPRRQEILGSLEWPFIVQPVATDETSVDIQTLPPWEAVRAIAGIKSAAAAAAIHENAVILTADTIVALDNTILLKPKDEADAFRMLSLLSGREHMVYTSVFIVEKQGRHVSKAVDFTERALVEFGNLTPQEIKAYIKTKEPMDKAGAYGIQGHGGKFVRQIHGDFYCVMGLPLYKTYEALKTFGY